MSVEEIASKFYWSNQLRFEWTWKVLKSVSHSVVSNSLRPQAPLSMELLRQEYWRELPFPSPGDWTWVSGIAGGFFTFWVIREALMSVTPTKL